MQSKENLGKKREETGRGREVRTKYQMERGRKTHSCSERREADGEVGQERLVGAGAASSWLGMGTWGFVYYPTGTEPGASFIGSGSEMNERPSSGVPGEFSQSRELNVLVLAGSQAQGK